MRRSKPTFTPLMVFGSTAVVVILAAAALNLGTEAASFRIAQLSPDAPLLDVTVDGVAYEAGMSYGQFGEWHSNGKSGSMMVEARLAGTSPESTPLLRAEVILHPGTPTIIAMANRLEHLQIGAYPIPMGDLSAGFARVQVLNAMPNQPRIGVRAGSDVIASELGYLEDPVYADVPPGEARMLGFTMDIPATLLLDENTTLQAGSVTTVILAGPPVQVILLTTTIP
jgi:hypothetical protein